VRSGEQGLKFQSQLQRPRVLRGWFADVYSFALPNNCCFGRVSGIFSEIIEVLNGGGSFACGYSTFFENAGLCEMN
jgi:hypothetical protein